MRGRFRGRARRQGVVEGSSDVAVAEESQSTVKLRGRMDDLEEKWKRFMLLEEEILDIFIKNNASEEQRTKNKGQRSLVGNVCLTRNYKQGGSGVTNGKNM